MWANTTHCKVIGSLCLPVYLGHLTIRLVLFRSPFLSQIYCNQNCKKLISSSVGPRSSNFYMWSADVSFTVFYIYMCIYSLFLTSYAYIRCFFPPLLRLLGTYLIYWCCHLPFLRLLVSPPTSRVVLPTFWDWHEAAAYTLRNELWGKRGRLARGG